jgi:hypothetical protein
MRPTVILDAFGHSLFFRPKHIAREIAAYAGKNVTKT